MTWYPEAEDLLLQGNYQELVTLYEKKIENNPDNVDNYWYLGLVYLFLGKDEEAQTTWFLPFSLATETEIETWTEDLVTIVDSEAIRQESLSNYQLAWLIRLHLREIEPKLINNILHLIDLEIKLNTCKIENLETYQLETLLRENSYHALDTILLWEILPKIVIFAEEKSLGLVDASLNYMYDSSVCIEKLKDLALHFEYIKPIISIELTNLCLKVFPDEVYFLKNLALFYRKNRSYNKSVEISYQLKYKLENKTDNIGTKALFNTLLLECLLEAGYWDKLPSVFSYHKVLLQQAIQENICPGIRKDGNLSTLSFLYYEDNPAENRPLNNEIARLFQAKTRQNYGNPQWQNFSVTPPKSSPLKIGYIAETLYSHSVGWLARWLYKYHNHKNFRIFTYHVGKIQNIFTKQWFQANSECYHFLPSDTNKIAEQVWSDKIDILVDLDSFTNQITCQVMALKPAPIQVTWLGMDATGIPAIDYFIADPYVLPENAQDYYSEKIWRLPHTYLGVDGFEVNIPNLTRKNLDIPEDAIIYLNMQNAAKRHPNMIHNQMKIIKAVDNAYFLIKGSGDQEVLKHLFISIAEQEGVNLDRLRFLPKTPTEAIHRANLKIADVVLDTYPYNGATTTLETLWMEIPLVTRVGEQFAARNSYTFMMNAGITEGIAWTDEEYIDWGIKLGKDENLRKEIAWKLRQSKKTSPLWNAKQFTLEMEKAYRQMWEIYLKENQ